MSQRGNLMVTYEPDNTLRYGYRTIFREIARELLKSRWLISQLFKRDFFALYRQSFLGMLWALLLPVISIGTFLLLSRAGLLSIGILSVPYPVYALFGLMCWQVFAFGLINGANALVRAGAMIVKINFSKKALVIAAASQTLVSFLVQFSIFVLLLVIYHVKPHPTIILLPLLILPLFLLMIGLSFILSILNGIMRDVGNVLSMLLTFFMFLTPILYVEPSQGVLAAITRFNPIYYLISGPREVVLQGTISDLPGFLISSGISLIVFLLCLIGFHLAETRIAERI